MFSVFAGNTRALQTVFSSLTTAQERGAGRAACLVVYRLGVRGLSGDVLMGSLCRLWTGMDFWWSSYIEHMMDALAPTGDEGRGKLR